MDRKDVLVFVCIYFISIFGMILYAGRPSISDETIHFQQISTILHGHWLMIPKITVPPGYHTIIAGFMFLTHTDTFDWARIFTTLILTLSLIPIFWGLTHSWRRVFQLYFFPIMFVFYFMIYTDMMSLVFVGLAVYLLFKDRYILSGIVFTLSMAVRQNNFVWLLFGLAYITLNSKVLSHVFADFPQNWRLNLQNYDFKLLFSKTWTYFIGFIVFGAFIIWNKGLVVGDKISHPVGFYTTNIFYILFLMFFLFLPLILFKVKAMWGWISTHKVISILIVVSSILFCILTYHNTHWYNNSEIQGPITGTGILRNQILHFADVSVINKLIFMVPILISIFYLVTVKFKDKLQYLLYPAAILYIAGSELVDPRYYIIPYALFMIFRLEDGEKEEKYFTTYCVILGIIFFIGILRTSLVW